MVADYEIVKRINGWSIKYTDNTGKERDKYFTDLTERNQFINDLRNRMKVKDDKKWAERDSDRTGYIS